MRNNFIDVYDYVLDQGISPIDLYIYDCIVNDDNTFGMSEKDLEKNVIKIREDYMNDPQLRSLSFFIDKFIDGDYNEEEEWD